MEKVPLMSSTSHRTFPMYERASAALKLHDMIRTPATPLQHAPLVGCATSSSQNHWMTQSGSRRMMIPINLAHNSVVIPFTYVQVQGKASMAEFEFSQPWGEYRVTNRKGGLRRYCLPMLIHPPPPFPLNLADF